MSRPSWDYYFSKIARDVAERSTCIRHKIGAVIVNEDHEIVATGYNGVVRGAPHCDEIGCIKDKNDIPSGTGHEICPAVHAEQNALIQAGRLSKGCTLYVNAFPCKICARLIVNAGIKRVVTSGEYTDKEGLKILKEAGIIVSHINLDEEEGELDLE
ncbi:MAG: cytidine deaminase [Candidatus Altiarchaeales archaeon]|nr:MAG: cytidine deaminase [Candidatus Altiarchaeales archaeon]RLI93518.1 MAG: cytidine deaminase [Candidatus Altiarchaeales archaeon]RLI94358.1 MAG: cytidine deaminase [Candidatus Altiarchaeales archaeon]HDO81998.1 cytidine deaminase [Candidatus Altiarchaeales archaeon]HEX54647.1 cytidine deaminase [Candidatus Altiarchaeales archaeon]